MDVWLTGSSCSIGEASPSFSNIVLARSTGVCHFFRFSSSIRMDDQKGALIGLR